MSDDFEDLEYKTPGIKSKEPVAKTPSAEKIGVFFKATVGPGETTEKMAVSKNTPIRDIKSAVGQVFGLPPEDFHLSHAGRTLDPNETIGSCNIEDDDEILLIPLSTAG
ncbi:MAG: ubiquitin-like domain-containing protein [Candidatus Hermodarchaeota archaeon]